MSYKTFKHLIGETSLERKCRFLFGAGVLTLITASFFLYARNMEAMVDRHLRDICRLLVSPILLERHWLVLETYEDFVPTIERMHEDLIPKKLKGYRWKIIKSAMEEDNASTRPANEFELDAIREFEDGDAEWKGRRLSDEPAYEYITAIRLQDECIPCHRVKTGGEFYQVGDMFAAMSVSIPVVETNEAIRDNRVILVATAVVTATLAMLVFYVIVRYVIAKPVKHLKDVSDAVSDGNLLIRADIQTGDEFEGLSHAFNRMLRNLIAMQEELRGVNRTLDRKVDELAQANMALFEMNQLKNDFLATMSHELRTPLNSVIGFSEVLGNSEKLSDRERRYATNIEKSGKLLLSMINDLLDLAKIESGRMEIRAEEFSLRDVIEGLVTMIKPVAEEKNVALRSQVDLDVPVVYQDPGKIQQIVYNLLSNAVKFTPEQGTVEIDAGSSRTEMVLAVKDSGVGIAPEDRERIFEKFRQGSNGTRGSDSTLTRQYTGSGLGLSIVRELCHMLGGDVSLESQLGKGSTFTVRLPLRLEESQTVRVSLGDGVDPSKARRIDARVLTPSANQP